MGAEREGLGIHVGEFDEMGDVYLEVGYVR